MSATPAPPDAQQAAPPARPAWQVWLRRVLAVLWVAAIVTYLFVDGIPVDRETIIAFTVAGLLIWSYGRRPLWSVLVDWLPFVAVLVVYDFTRGLAEVIGSPTQWIWQIDADRLLGFGVIPTTWLQEHLKQTSPPLWEVGISVVYISFYFVPYLVAGWLWLRGRADFRQFAVRFVSLSFLGVVIFIAMPAAPPWAASQCSAAQVADHPAEPPCMFSGAGAPANGLLGSYESRTDDPATSVDRISSRGFASLHLKNAVQLLDKGQASVNLVAAIPSLHAAITMMLSLFLWPRVRKAWRVLLVFYPIAMAFTLVYSAEHYVTDILIGWALAIGLEIVVRRISAARSARRAATQPDAQAGTDLTKSRDSAVASGSSSLP